MKKLLLLVVLMLSVFAFTVTFVDDAGRIVSLERPPERVICAAPSATKFLEYLGLTDRIVGVTNWDTFESERIGDLYPLNMEKILSLNPDLVILFGGFQLPEVTKLEEMNIPSLVLNANSVKGVLDDLVLLGVVFDIGKKAKERAQKLEQYYLEIAKKAYNIPYGERVRVAFISDVPGPDVKEIWTGGQGSFINELITLAGGVNIASGLTGPNGYLPLSIEYIVSQDPDVMIATTYSYGTEQQIIEKLKEYAPFSDIKAVKNSRIYVFHVDEVSLPVPQTISLVEKFYNIFYGEK